MQQHVGGFLAGVRAVFVGFTVMWAPGVRRYALIPLLLNIILFVVLLHVAIHGMQAFINSLLQHLPAWLAWLSYLLWFLFAIIYWLGLVSIFTFMANVLALPFNALLAEQALYHLTGKSLPSWGWRMWLAVLPRTAYRQWQWLCYALPRLLLVFLIFFVPFLHLFILPIWVLLHSWLMALQYIDYHMDNHQVSFFEVRQRLALERGSALGFGATVTCCYWLPLLNAILMPAAVCGATYLCVMTPAWSEHTAAIMPEQELL